MYSCIHICHHCYHKQKYIYLLWRALTALGVGAVLVETSSPNLLALTAKVFSVTYKINEYTVVMTELQAE